MSSLIGAPINLGQNIDGVQNAPAKLREYRIYDYFTHDEGDIVIPNNSENIYESIGKSTYELYKKILKAQNKFMVIGGDHTISIGSIHAALAKNENIGVIWVDAHADINTPETSISGNLHGQPVSFLMNLHNAWELPGFHWTKDLKKLSPSKIVYIGLRNIDDAEYTLLHKHNICYFTMNDVHTYGIEHVMSQALYYLKDIPLHLSLDIDSLDPNIAESTGTPEKNGLSRSDVLYICDNVKSRLMSMDLVELNPLIGNNMSTIEISLEITRRCWLFQSKL